MCVCVFSYQMGNNATLRNSEDDNIQSHTIEFDFVYHVHYDEMARNSETGRGM